jgi:hypothetical protein
MASLVIVEGASLMLGVGEEAPLTRSRSILELHRRKAGAEKPVPRAERDCSSRAMRARQPGNRQSLSEQGRRGVVKHTWQCRGASLRRKDKCHGPHTSSRSAGLQKAGYSRHTQTLFQKRVLSQKELTAHCVRASFREYTEG